MFSTDKGHYFIEPVRKHDMSSSQHQPHLVYKKSALPDDMHMNGDMEKMSCGVGMCTYCLCISVAPKRKLI